MACNPEDILLYVEGELGPEEAARVRAHTAVCEGCRELLATEQALGTALGGLKAFEPPKDFCTATVRRAECDVTHALRSSGERRRAFAITASLASLSLLLLWPTGFLASTLEALAPLRCMARFALGRLESSAVSLFVISRTASRFLLEEASLPVGAAVGLLALLLGFLAWLIAGYRRQAAERGGVR